MKKNICVLIALVCCFATWTPTDAQAFEIVTREMIEKEIVTKTDLMRIVDNFVILFDTSESTNQMVPGKSISKIQAAKDLLKERNAWLPDLGYQAGLYIYTNRFKKLNPVMEMQPYDRDRLAAAIDQLPEKGSGPTTMRAGISGLRKVLAGLTGKTAVIVFTDGKVTTPTGGKSAQQIAQEIAEEHDVCFYLISSATEEANEKILEAVAKVKACSRVVPIQTYLNNPHYWSGTLFTVKTTSYARFKPVTQVVGIVADDMLFDFDSSTIRNEYHEKLDMLGDFLQNNPQAYVVAGGFSDSAGDDEYNLWLSKMRVAGVKNYLVDQFSIDADRIVTLWYGEANPVADNTTSDGRQRNRRVEIAVGGV